MRSPATIKAIVFDAYGTLFDVHSVGALAETLFPLSGAKLTELWRVAQIDYTRMRTLGDRYVDFHQVTLDALDFAAARLGLALDAATRARLMHQYERLALFPEVNEVVRLLGVRRVPLAILSNGTQALLEKLVLNAGLSGLFERLLSVDSVRAYKPAPAAYALGPAVFSCSAAEIVFVSANGWDACGAAWFGYTTFWVNRAGAPLDRLGISPHQEGKSLRDLIAYVGA